MGQAKPTPEQLAWQNDQLGAFFHCGLNTFHGKEWSDGTLPASSFDPTDLDARQWVQVAADMGAKYVVLTAKHHDGFCLWPTNTTDYSVAASPWKEGEGDVVRDVALACEEFGLKLGIYLSPWDRNNPAYSDPKAYTELYCQQLTELCTQYGPISELWFDGAGSEGYQYDWEKIMEVAERHQPDAMIFNMGAPTIRWVGNEDGLASDPVEYAVSDTQMSNYTAETTDFSESLYLPPECDVSIRRNWFWREDDEPKSLEHLLAIYYSSVGLGANLLLNVPPDTRGQIDPEDAKVARQFGEEIDRRFGSPTKLDILEVEPGIWEAEVPAPFDHLRLVEHLCDGQKVAAHRVLLGGKEIAGGQTVGAGRIHLVGSQSPSILRIELVGEGATLGSVETFLTGATEEPQVPEGYVAPTDTPDS